MREFSLRVLLFSALLWIPVSNQALATENTLVDEDFEPCNPTCQDEWDSSPLLTITVFRSPIAADATSTFDVNNQQLELTQTLEPSDNPSCCTATEAYFYIPLRNGVYQPSTDGGDIGFIDFSLTTELVDFSLETAGTDITDGIVEVTLGAFDFGNSIFYVADGHHSSDLRSASTHVFTGLHASDFHRVGPSSPPNSETPDFGNEAWIFFIALYIETGDVSANQANVIDWNVDDVLLTLHVGPDSDGDRYPDDEDNCIEATNPAQDDTDGDDCGNLCDADYNQDGRVGIGDFGWFVLSFNTPGEERCHFEPIPGCVVGLDDFGFFVGVFNTVPGPSGTTAGTIPCPL